MNHQAVIDTLVEQLRRMPSVEGVYLAGSLVTPHADAFSDIDLGVATRQGSAGLAEAFACVPQLARAVGEPLALLERGWEHTRMVALLYGNEHFPPHGLEVDIAFSRLKHVGEQMPHVPYRVLYDRRGRLSKALAALPRERPSDSIAADLREQMRWFAFLVHDALKTHRRGDRLHFQALAEQLRQAIYAAAAVRRGNLALGAKRATATLTIEEHKAVRGSYLGFSRTCVHDLTAVYLDCLAGLAPVYGIEDEVARLRAALRQLL